ncbi:MAG TPA: MFS transporter [Candidimonas sp.]|nr:MFS transporter [Candidimonas sp.]
MTDTASLKRNDWLTIGLVGIVHASSHFFQLVLPTLYLSLAHEYGYDFVKLGMLASAFFLVSCIGQASSGFVVDRIGPAPVLRFGLSCFIISGIIIGASDSYSMLMLAAIIGGIGNSVFHPVDYSILNHRVSAHRLGHAFSTHGLTGNLGWALTPVFMAAVIYLSNWRVAAFSASALVALILLLTWVGRGLLAGKNMVDNVDDATPASAAPGMALANQSAYRTLTTLLAQPALWGAFLFFACTSIALSAVQNYTIPMLDQMYGIERMLAGTALSGYMVAAAVGMVAGGFVASATPNAERTVAVSLILAGGLLVILAMGAVSPSLAMVLVGLAGFCSGVSAPSRDMLIRRVTPKGATGTVYGLVYSGMDVGSSLAPVTFGLMLDAGLTQGPWFGAAAGFVTAAILAVLVARTASAAPVRPVHA